MKFWKDLWYPVSFPEFPPLSCPLISSPQLILPVLLFSSKLLDNCVLSLVL